MPKLTAEQIAFIDRYLENSGIEYFDVRVEMADHVATAIEQTDGDFHENFRVYMEQHKDELLASYKKQKTVMLRMAAKQFFVTAIKPQWLGLLVVLAIGVALMTDRAGIKTAVNILEYTFVGISVIAGVYLLCSFWWNRRKYFMTWTMLLCNYIGLAWILLIFNYDNILEAITPYAELVYYTLLWYLLIVFYITFFRIRRKLMQRYSPLQIS